MPSSFVIYIAFYYRSFLHATSSRIVNNIFLFINIGQYFVNTIARFLWSSFVGEYGSRLETAHISEDIALYVGHHIFLCHYHCRYTRLHISYHLPCLSLTFCAYNTTGFNVIFTLFFPHHHHIHFPPRYHIVIFYSHIIFIRHCIVIIRSSFDVIRGYIFQCRPSMVNNTAHILRQYQYHCAIPISHFPLS